MSYEDEIDPQDVEFIRALPKAELHVHLEGSIRPATLLTLARRHGVDLGATDEATLRDLYRFRDFRHFIDLYGTILNALREPDDFALITEELGRDAAAQGTRYLEVTFTAQSHHYNKGIPFAELMDALATGAATARQATGVEMRFILDHVRGFPAEICQQNAEWCVAGRDRGVVALGLAGFEAGGRAADYAAPIRWAQSQGVACIPHAGEAAGPESVWDVLAFDPPRIGHGFRAFDDPALVADLVARGTVLEICPTSNVCTGSVPTLEAHPVRRLYDAGVGITVNSDDPPMFNTTLTNEYLLLAARFGFTRRELADLSLAAVRASLLPAAEKAVLEAEFIADIDRLLAAMPSGAD